MLVGAGGTENNVDYDDSAQKVSEEKNIIKWAKRLFLHYLAKNVAVLFFFCPVQESLRLN